MRQSIEQKFEAELCGLKELIEDKFARNKEDHEKIIEQTTKTNGSVRELQKWRAFTNGVMSVLTVLVLPLAFYLLKVWIEGH